MHNSETNRPFHVVKEETVHQGKWISTKYVTFKDRQGTERVWEHITRSFHKPGAPDGVVAIPLLKKLNEEDHLILIRQYRMAIQTYCIEFPAGIIDSDETVENAALRELKEESGYTTNKITSISPATALDQGIEDSTVCYVTLEVDGNSPENQSPKQDLDDSESIEVLKVPPRLLLSRLQEYAASGDVIDSRLYLYALGLASNLSVQAVDKS